MATTQALQDTYLTSFDTLFEDVRPHSTVTGSWFPIRLAPDLATGELFNIGVGFLEDSGKLHTKLIPNASAFRCLYGPAGVESFNFLLSVTREHFNKVTTPLPPSPHICIGAQVPARGETPAGILDDLYDTLVTLICTDDTAKLTEITHVSTLDVRKMVFRRMKQQMPSLFERIHCKSPVTLKDNQGRSVSLDIPLWDAHGDITRLNVPAVFGTIVSAYYKDDVHRGYNVNSGSVTVTTAADILGKESRGCFLIYRPDHGASGYSDADMLKVDNDIDKAVWMVRRHHPKTRVEVENDTAKLAQYALELAS